jgi:hypothetical protein
MNKRWSDFLFAIAVRVVCGLIIGALAGLLLGWQIVLRRAARDDMGWVVLWLLAWAAGGALVAVFRIPSWQKPWSQGIRDSNGDHGTRSNYNFRRVAPEAYNRMAHPSLKQFHDFVGWLRETTVAELERKRGDIGATKTVFVRFFRRGFKAGLLLAELTELLPSIVATAGYSEAEHSEVFAMLKGLNLEELGVRRDEKGVTFDDHAA